MAVRLRRIGGLPWAIKHHEVLAAFPAEQVEAVCKTVESEGTSGPSIEERVEARRRGEELASPHCEV